MKGLPASSPGPRRVSTRFASPSVVSLAFFTGGRGPTPPDLAAAEMGAAGGSLGPLSLGLGAFTTFVHATIPTSPDDYDGMRAAGARSAFGKDPEYLTEAQSNALNSRYDGPVGVANMISDQMDSTADEVGDFFGKVFGG